MKVTDKNTLEQVCSRFGVCNIYDLNQLHSKHDQELIKNLNFNLFDKTLVNNQIKDALLQIELTDLSKDEQQVVKNILWLWYHHATTVAIWKNHNLIQARECCDIALKYLYPSHPNKITPMIGMLLDGDIEKARKWAKKEVLEVEQEYATHLLDEYKKGVFNKEKSLAHKNTKD